MIHALRVAKTTSVYLRAKARFRTLAVVINFFLAQSVLSAWGQQPSAPPNHYQMPGMQHSHGMQHEHGNMEMKPATLIENIENHMGDGTSVEPNSTPTPMLMTTKGNWMLMLHGLGFINMEQQSGTRGYDKIFSTNWAMGMAQHDFAGGKLTLRAMLSLDPATVTHRYYPELFQTGETAFGRPIVDGQHPHDFIMELGVLYDRKIGDRGLLSLYAAPVGDPALGPTAYPHRMSASEDPIASLGHHQQDSTHIASSVFTVGGTYRIVRLEASGFHGREPNEQRWDIDTGGIDSWAARLTVNPNQNWSLQYSLGSLHSPEETHPQENVRRMTASAGYNRPLTNGNWASTLVWGRNRSLHTGDVFNGYLLESTLRFATRNYVWSRIENTDRSNELLFTKGNVPPGFEEAPLARVQAYTFGYDRDIDLVPHLATAIGGQATAYAVPDKLKSKYGSHAAGVVLVVRLRPFRNQR